jgi:hypothetical protein
LRWEWLGDKISIHQVHPQATGKIIGYLERGCKDPKDEAKLDPQRNEGASITFGDSEKAVAKGEITKDEFEQMKTDLSDLKDVENESSIDSR